MTAIKAIAFYRDALGFEVRNDVSAHGMRWVTIGSPSQPDVNIVLEPPAADLEATFERVQASGADVIQEPMDQPWGARDCAVRDPAGNMIRIIQTRE